MGFYCRLICITWYNSLVLTVLHADVPPAHLFRSLIDLYYTSLFLTADPGRSGKKDNVILTRLMVNQTQYSTVWHLATVSCSKLLYWCFSELTIHQARTIRGLDLLPTPPGFLIERREESLGRNGICNDTTGILGNVNKLLRGHPPGYSEPWIQ